MRSVGATLSTFLDATTACPPIRHLITVTPKTGSTVRWTDHERDIFLSPNTFLAGGEGTTNPLPKIGRSRRTHGTENIDKLALKLFCADQALFNGARLPLFAAQRGFDGAVVKVERLYIPDTGGLVSLGSMWWFEGPVGAVKPTSLTVDLEVESGIAFLKSVQLPRIVIQPGCVHQLYDAECALVKASFTDTGVTVRASPAPTTLTFDANVPTGGGGAMTRPTGYYQLGVLAFTSGTNNGLQRAVRVYTYGGAGVGTFTLDRPLPVAPSAADAFSVYPGCTKTQAVCSNSDLTVGPAFNNLVHFRGFPYVPRQEVAG